MYSSSLFIDLLNAVIDYFFISYFPQWIMMLGSVQRIKGVRARQ